MKVRQELPRIPSHNLPLAERFAYYQRQVEANKGVVEVGKATILGMRGLAPDGERHDSAENIGPYNDTFVVLQRFEDGSLALNELRGQTHAGQKSSSLSPDGVAQIRPGNYQCQPNGPFHDMPSYQVLTRAGQDGIPCWRDIDKNGYISKKEKAKGQSAGTLATEILFHNGVNEDHGRSIGCQTLHPKVMQRLIDILGVEARFHYTLIDANQPTPTKGSR